MTLSKARKNFGKELLSGIHGSFGIISAQNPQGKKLSPEENEQRHQSLVSDIKAMGGKPVGAMGKWGDKEKSVIALGIKPKGLLSLGAKYGQEAVIHSGKGGKNTMMFTGGENKGQFVSGKGNEILNLKDTQDQYTQTGKIKFRLNFDFSSMKKFGKSEGCTEDYFEIDDKEIEEMLGELVKKSDDEARELGEKIGINWSESKFDVSEFKQGLEVELEHGKKDEETNVTDNDPVKTAKIALAHLNEMPDYYTKLKQMESSKKEDGMKDKKEVKKAVPLPKMPPTPIEDNPKNKEKEDTNMKNNNKSKDVKLGPRTKDAINRVKTNLKNLSRLEKETFLMAAVQADHDDAAKVTEADLTPEKKPIKKSGVDDAAAGLDLIKADESCRSKISNVAKENVDKIQKGWFTTPEENMPTTARGNKVVGQTSSGKPRLKSEFVRNAPKKSKAAWDSTKQVEKIKDMKSGLGQDFGLDINNYHLNAAKNHLNAAFHQHLAGNKLISHQHMDTASAHMDAIGDSPVRSKEKWQGRFNDTAAYVGWKK